MRPERTTILHLTGMVSTKYGGIEKYFLEVVRACNALGYRSVFQYDRLPESAEFRADMAALGAELVVEKLSIDPVPIVRMLRAYRPLVLNSHHCNKAVLFWLSLLAKPLGVRRLVHVEHSLMDATKPRLSRIRVFAYNRYDRILGVSRAIADFTKANGVDPKLVSVLYLGRAGVAQSAQLRERFRRRFGLDAGRIVIGCIAWDTPFKGLDVLLEAFRDVVRSHPDAHLVIVGVDPDASALPALAERLGIGSSVHWTGIIDAGWQALCAADVYVQPSRFAEGLSVATAEAMALSLPVVATRVAGPAEIVLHEETGLLCAPDDVFALRDALLSMLDRRERWAAFGAAGRRRFTELFSLERSVNELLRNYGLS